MSFESRIDYKTINGCQYIVSDGSTIVARITTSKIHDVTLKKTWKYNIRYSDGYNALSCCHYTESEAYDAAMENIEEHLS
ncbi:hypothetical protein N9137_03250 [Pseudomonadales bacterium]|nr:hypothetical protein [Pseudomonadales bacterium]